MEISDRLNLLIIVLCVLAVFAQTASFSFLDYDDPVNIVKNRFVTEPSMPNLRAVWEKSYFGLYIPVTYTFWMGISVFSHIIYGNKNLNPALFHGANILLHILNSLMVYWILSMIIYIRFPESKHRMHMLASFAGALFFALHPAHVEPVAWVTGFKDLLSSFFFLLAVGFGLKPHIPRVTAKSAAISSYIPVTLFFILAVFSKPSAVVLPVFIFILIRFVLGIKPDRTWNMFFILWLATAVMVILITRTVQPEANIVPFAKRIVIACYAAVFYISKIAWPWSLSIDYGKTVSNILGQPAIYFYPAILAGLAGTSWLLTGKKEIFACLLLVIICTAPVFGLIPFAFQKISTVADRYLYLAVFAASIGLSFAVVRYFSQGIFLALILLLILFGMRAASYTSKWSSAETLMRYTLDRNPKSFVAAHDLGVALMKKGRMNEAISFLKYALKLDHLNPRVRYDLAISYECIGNTAAADAEMKKVMMHDAGLGRILEKILPIVSKYIQAGDLPINLKPIDN